MKTVFAVPTKAGADLIKMTSGLRNLRQGAAERDKE